jgi:Protein of unknown function (DUF732)
MKIVAIGVALTASIVLAPQASAYGSGNADYLDCLTNHGISVNNQDEALDLASKIQSDLNSGVPVPTIVANLVIYHDMQFSLAQEDVKCVAAATLMGE